MYTNNLVELKVDFGNITIAPEFTEPNQIILNRSGFCYVTEQLPS